MAMREWVIGRIAVETDNPKGWPFKNALIAICPYCQDRMIVPLSWRRKNKYKTAPCPLCFKASRIPKLPHV